MLLIKLILRNILAHRLRSLIIFLVVMLVTAVLFLFLAFSDGQIENYRKSLLDLFESESDLVVRKKGFKTARERNEPWEYIVQLTITDYRELLKQIINLPQVASAYPEAWWPSGELLAGGEVFESLGFACLAPGYDEHIKEKIEITAGRYIKKEDKNCILLHYSIKKDLQVDPGATVTVLTSDFFGQAVVLELTVIGYYRPRIDHPGLRQICYTDMSAFSMISGYYENEIVELRINLKPGISRDQAIVNLNQWAVAQDLPVEFYYFEDFYQRDMKLYQVIRRIIIIMCFVIIFIVSFGIMNIVAVNLADRRKEIGTYYCLGTEKGLLTWLYSLEILVINLCAALAGIATGLLVRWFINFLAIRTTDPSLQNVFGGDRFYLGYSPATAGWILLGLFLITLLTALTSLQGALKVSPVAAMREDGE